MKKVKLDKSVRTIEVFYDARCGMCCTFMEWLEKQDRACELISYDYQADEAKKVFPDLASYHPEKEMVVRMDGEEIYQGGEGWVCSLWSCAKYRDVAQKMNGCVLLPMAKKICHLISRNRLGMSKLFFGKKSKEIAVEIERTEQITCEGGCEK